MQRRYLRVCHGFSLPLTEFSLAKLSVAASSLNSSSFTTPLVSEPTLYCLFAYFPLPPQREETESSSLSHSQSSLFTCSRYLNQPHDSCNFNGDRGRQKQPKRHQQSAAPRLCAYIFMPLLPLMRTLAVDEEEAMANYDMHALV